MATIGIKGGGNLEKVLAELADKAGKRVGVMVGFQDGATYPAVEGGNPVYVAQVAFWGEYGTKRSPPRPFFRQMIDNKSGKWPKNVARVAAANDYDMVKTMGIVGVAISDQLRDSIINGAWEPNADSTIAKKGFDKPLQHTELMVRSISAEVVEP